MQKKSLMKIWQLLLLAVVCFGVTGVKAVTTVNVETAGTLSTLLTTTETQLKVTGFINGTDVKYLRELIDNGKVTTLDLGEVKIVSGGEAYYNDYTTENDVIGTSMFKGCSKLRNIVLPEVYTIAATAFSNSGLQKVDIPNSVTKLGGDAFAYCSSLATVVIGKRVKTLDQGVFYSSPVKHAYVKMATPPATPAYLFSSNPTIHVYSDVLDSYKASSWKNYGTITGKLEDTYPKEKDPIDIIKESFPGYFEDAACSQLKSEYQTMSDEELTAAMTSVGMPASMIAVALKIKNNTWAPYEQYFRVHSYQAYSDASYWSSKLMSTGGCYMGNPTGIYSADQSPLYVFVDSDIPEDATLYITGCTGNTLIYSATSGTKLTKGLNIIEGQKDALYYILYTADTRSMTKTLDEWPDMKIHIEGGVVNGYYELSRHSDTDYQALLNAATHELFTAKGGRCVYNFKRESYKEVWPRSIDKSLIWFDSITVWEKELMGYCVSVANGERAGAPFYLTGGEAIYPAYYNNPNFCIEGNASSSGWANSTTYRTSYNSLACIKSALDVTQANHDEWCAAHETGHNNQRAINLEGCTEVSNNLFSNYIRFHSGISTTSGLSLAVTMNDFANHVPFFTRDISSMMRMYFQLYLYYHLGQRNISFFPTLFKALREDPLSLWSNTNNSSLKFVRKVCEVAQEDLTDFFAAWGFFEPFDNLTINDYGTHTFSVRQADIDATLEEISKYPVKNRQILFVEDRIDYIPTTGFLTTPGQKRRDSDKVGQCGNLGQFTSYLPGGSEPSSYTYSQSDSIYAMHGSGGVGFVLLDSEEHMIFGSNSTSFCVPNCLGTDFTIYSIDADGTLHPTRREGEGTVTVTLTRAGTLSDSLPDQTIKAIINGPLNGTDVKYLRELLTDGDLSSIDLSGARMASGGSAYYNNYRGVANAIGTSAFNGMMNLVNITLPEKITKIEGTAFANSGLKEIVIPENVTNIGGDAFAYCGQLTRVVIGSKVKNMSQGVFYSSPVKEAFVRALTPPTIAAYLFSSKPVIHVYASALEAYLASPWAQFGTIVGDLEDYDYMFYDAADVNRDGVIDSADIVAVIKEMPDGAEKADVNRDGVIDSADIVAVIKAMK